MEINPALMGLGCTLEKKKKSLMEWSSKPAKAYSK